MTRKRHEGVSVVNQRMVLPVFGTRTRPLSSWCTPQKSVVGGETQRSDRCRGRVAGRKRCHRGRECRFYPTLWLFVTVDARQRNRRVWVSVAAQRRQGRQSEDGFTGVWNTNEAVVVMECIESLRHVGTCAAIRAPARDRPGVKTRCAARMGGVAVRQMPRPRGRAEAMSSRS